MLTSIIFKGSTSLSKEYGLIRRFSEDIDLILNWNGFRLESEWNPAEKYGKTKKPTMLAELDAWNIRQISTNILPLVQECCGNVCTAAIPEAEPEIITITYPQLWEGSYIRPEIKLEIGPKAAWNPHETHEIIPYVAERYPHLFTNAHCRVKATTAERELWEKATILHSQAGSPSQLPSRYARHYYDTAMMARNADLKKRALADVPLLYQVASFKYYFYRAGWADYPNAHPGTMHLMPQGHILNELAKDYESMRREMLPQDAPELDTILEEIRQLEADINQLTPLPLDIRNYPSMEVM